MPARYEAIRNKFEAKGTPAKEAKTRAAKIFNATRKKGQAPVTNHPADDLGSMMTRK